jgi:hypothetical protein
MDPGDKERSRWRGKDGRPLTWEQVYGKARASIMRRKLKSPRRRLYDPPPELGETTKILRRWGDTQTRPSNYRARHWGKKRRAIHRMLMRMGLEDARGNPTTYKA